MLFQETWHSSPKTQNTCIHRTACFVRILPKQNQYYVLPMHVVTILAVIYICLFSILIIIINPITPRILTSTSQPLCYFQYLLPVWSMIQAANFWSQAGTNTSTCSITLWDSDLGWQSWRSRR